MIVGYEWIIDAAGCDAELLRNEARLREVFKRLLNDLGLKALGGEHWHKFPGEGGVTGLLMLTESHLACHTYPEYRAATFNLYCCRERPRWNWEANLAEMLGAESVKVQAIERGDETRFADPFKSQIPNSKSQIVGGAK